MKRRIILILAAVALVIGVVVFFVMRNRKISGIAVVRELESRSASDYTAVGDRLIRYGKEGTEAVKVDGSKLWDITYTTMKNPLFAFASDMAAVADVGSKQYYLTDGGGVARSYTMAYPIQAICVAKQGVTAVLMNDEEKDYITLYDQEGTVLSEICTIVARDGFPMAMALSPDGTKLVTSYMKIEDDEVLTNLTFYNFDEVGKNYTRNLVGQVQYTESLVPRLAFMGNDTVVAVGEKAIEFFAMTELPASISKRELTSEIKSIAIDEYLCVVTSNEQNSDVLEVFDRNGNVNMKKMISIPYIGIHTGGKEVVVYSYAECEFFKIGEGLTFTTPMENGIRAMFATGKNRYFCVEDRGVKVIKLVKGKGK